MAYMAATGHFMGAGVMELFGNPDNEQLAPIASSVLGLTGAMLDPVAKPI